METKTIKKRFMGELATLNDSMGTITDVVKGTSGKILSKTFSDLIDVMDIAMWQLDLDYRVVGFNKKAKEIYGAEALGEFCYYAAAKRSKVCEICPAKMVYDGEPSGRSQHKRTNASGRDIYIDHIATPIRDAHGNLTGSLVLIIDITQQKTQEIELLEHRNNLEKLVRVRTHELNESRTKYRKLYEQSHRAEKLYQSLLNSSADAIVIYNLDGEVQYINSSFTDIFGWCLNEIIGRRIPFVPESEREPTIREINRLIATGEPSRNFRTKRKTSDGRLLDIYISASRYDDHHGDPMGILVILKDMTEIRALEMQLQRVQKIEALATLAGGIAHDFNNLMMGIQGNTALLLLDHTANDGFREKLRNIEEFARRGGDLTRQLLGLAKEGKYEVKPSDLNKLINDCSLMFGQTRKEIHIHREFRQNIRPVEVDRGQIEQVLLNVLVNAGQAMPSGGDLYLGTQNIQLGIEFVSPYRLKPGHYVKVSIKDTGTGIAEEIKDKIFDPFFTTKEKERGTGLGLASAYGIIRNHGGMITVDSQEGNGTTFDIYLPASEKEITVESKPATRILEGAETILLIDDEEMVASVGKKLLERLGYKVLVAGSGLEALRLFEANKDHIDLIILDMIMPGLSGSETFDRLISIKPEIKTILSSGYSLNRQANALLDRGCIGFIQKPFSLREISQKLRDILDDTS